MKTAADITPAGMAVMSKIKLELYIYSFFQTLPSHFQRTVFFLSLQAREERNYHVFYELLAGMNHWDKQELYLQGAETYYYLNQVRVPTRRISEFARLFRPQLSPPSSSRAVPVN